MYVPLKIGLVVWIVATALIQQSPGRQSPGRQSPGKQSPGKPGDLADFTELSRLEKVWNEAHVRGDADALDRLWADDLTVAVPNMPVMNKQSAVAMAKSGRIKFQRYETSEIGIRLYGDAAVVTGLLERTRSLNGRDVNDKWRFTKVYIRHARKWQVVAWHASTIDQ